MAALPSVPNVCKIQIQGRCAGVPIATVFHLGYSGQPLTGQEALAIAEGVASEYTLHLSNLQTSAVALDTWVCTDLSSETGSAGIFESIVNGASAGTAVPNQVQLVISKAIGRRYRGGHPRTYFPGLNEAFLDTPTHWNAQHAVDVANGWTAMIGGITGNPSTPKITGEVCVHYIKNGAPLAFPLVDSTVGAIGRTLVGTLRDRLT